MSDSFLYLLQTVCIISSAYVYTGSIITSVFHRIRRHFRVFQQFQGGHSAEENYELAWNNDFKKKQQL